MDIVYVDSERDVAVVGRSLQTHLARGNPTFQYGLGKAMELDWGTFVYVFSYPAGLK